MITDEQAESAQHWLLENAKEAGRLLLARLKLEAELEAWESLQFITTPDGSVEWKKAYVKAKPEWKQLSESLAKAHADEIVNKGLVKAAEARISVFQTQSANVRGRL